MKLRSINSIRWVPVLALCSAALFGGRGVNAGVCAGCSVFYTDPDSSDVWLRDGDPRESSPSQKRGTINTFKFGSQLGGNYNLVFLDTLVYTGDTTADGHGVPAGQEIKACTLWVSATSLFFIGVDDVVYDLYSIDEAWNENDGNAVSWNYRTDAVSWTTAGVHGTLKTSSAVKMVRQDAGSYKWYTDVAGTLTLWDSVIVSVADSVPIPVHLDVATDMYHGVNYGLALKLDTALSANDIVHSFGSSENATIRRRPQFQWVFAPQKSLFGRRRIIESQ